MTSSVTSYVKETFIKALYILVFYQKTMKVLAFYLILVLFFPEIKGIVEVRLNLTTKLCN